jgi:PAS domain S-box-containing protein
MIMEAIELIISTIALLIGVLLLVMNHRRGNSRAGIIAYSICLILGAISFSVVSYFTNLHLILASGIILYLFIGYIPAFVFTYILGTIVPSQRIYYRIFIVLAILPLFFLITAAIQPSRDVLSTNLESKIISLISPGSIWVGLLLLYSIGLLIASVILAIIISSANRRAFGKRSLFALNSAVIACVILEAASFTTLLPLINKYTLVILGSSLIGLAIIYTNLRNPTTHILTRDELFTSINDGLIILDDDDKMMDLNPAAEKLLGISTLGAYGNPIASILTNWSSIPDSGENSEKEFRGSIVLNNELHHINVRINKLDNENGKVIILQDITDRKDENESRQRAREEIFNLLRAFFKSANTSQSSNEFFRDVLFQIAYTFRADNGAICLAESRPNSRKFKFSLMAKYGAQAEEIDPLPKQLEGLDISRWLQGNREPLVLSGMMDESGLGEEAQHMRNHSTLAFPLMNNDLLMGVLMLARTETGGFLADEIVRLEVVTEELASFIYSDRKRKADIALAERHRLAQDLHDSITQKLYGLVSLTEAVKLGLESGAPVNENKMMESISENARQALREMRLFLFELEPVNIERDGLVATLHQRLASVEGRSDIQARLIADEEILLPAGKETEIYYIVEEALNNILKHARAKSVLVKLIQKKDAIHLDIVDNGCGFDMDHVKLGGKGLGNIKERAKRIKAELKIISSPEHGTKVTLIVPQ